MNDGLSLPAARAVSLRMLFQIGFTDMIDAMIQFRKAAENAWEVLESYGFTLEKLEEIKAEIDAGAITRREGWSRLGLPAEDYRE